jgi:hypothetical protein
MKRKPSLPSLNKKLWSIFSQYIRRKDADSNGIVSCISCGTRKHWKTVDCGHYIPKSISLSLRFDERNNHSQCTSCNLWKHGNAPQYALALQKLYGPGILEELDTFRRDNQGFKLSRTDYEELIEKYKVKLAELDK